MAGFVDQAETFERNTGQVCALDFHVHAVNCSRVHEHELEIPKVGAEGHRAGAFLRPAFAELDQAFPGQVLEFDLAQLGLQGIESAHERHSPVQQVLDKDYHQPLFGGQRDLGANHVINHVENPNRGEQAKALTGGRGVDRVVEVGGPGTFAQSLKAVALSGQVSMLGVLSEGEMPGYLDMFLTFARFQTIATGNRQDLEDVIAAVSQNGIRPVIDSRFTFNDGKAALEHFGKRNVFGKVVITN